MRRAGVLASIVCALVVLTASGAGAARPASGSLSKIKKQTSWKGGPFTVSFVTPDPIVGCPGVDTCDHFALKVDLGEGARIRVTVRTPDPSDENDAVKSYDDYDLYVYAPDHSLAAYQISANGNETLVFTHHARWRNKPYDVAVDPWLVQPGSTFTATASVMSAAK